MIKIPEDQRAVALGARLRACPNVITLGVRPNFSDYSRYEQALIHNAEKIYYPSALYAELFDTLGKPTFPSYHTYKFSQDKIKQTALFALADIPHPHTRIFYGKRQKAAILDHFVLPLIAKIPRGSALGRGVFLIRTPGDLDRYCRIPGPAYIQAYLPMDRDMRVVVIGKQVVHAYWRIASPEEFRSNVFMGGRIDLAPLPEPALELARYVASVCHWDDVGLDICEFKGKYYVLEANMKYGRQGFQQAGIDYPQLMADLIDKGVI